MRYDTEMKQVFLGILAYCLYGLYSHSFRFRFKSSHGKSLELILKDIFTRGINSNRDESYLYAFFHQDELSFLKLFSGSEAVTIVSDSKDGEIMNQVVHLLGNYSSRGSSTRGGIKAFLGALRYIKQGHKLCHAVDGPKGPIYRVKNGVIKLSEKSGRKIVPMRAFPDRYFMFHKAWNKAKLPKLFAQITFVFGEPGFYTQEELEKVMQELSA